MSYINFRPWVGKNYDSGLFCGKKILILGESHYCTIERGEDGRCSQVCSKEMMDKRCTNQTIDVIGEIRNQDWCSRTFSNFERTIYGRIPEQELRREQ